MTITQSVEPAPPSLGGVASYHGRDLAFEVAGARTLSLEIRFRTAAGPTERTSFDQVVLYAGSEPTELGRCRYTPSAPGDETGGVLTPVETPLRCKDMVKHKRLSRLDQGFDPLPLLLQRKDQIRPEFRAYTADVVYEIAVYRSLFDEIDGLLAKEPPEVREEIARSIIATRGRSFMEFFDRRLAQLEELVKNFTKAEHERHGFYFRRHVWNFLLTSPFLTRTNLRPRGYAGDSQMMQYIYFNDYEGESTFGRLLHKHPAETAAAQAVRNRRKLIVDKVEAAYARRTDPARPLKLLSVACGPAWEVRDLYAKPEDCDRFESALLDQDDEALGEAEAAIEAVAKNLGARPRVRYLRDSVRTMLSTSDLPARFGKHDFIYSMGLFDYLTAPVAKSVSAKLYELLEPGGTLLIGNFHVKNPTRLYMEYWMDWVLLYRGEDDYHALAKNLPGSPQYEIFFEETKSQMFLEVRKPKA